MKKAILILLPFLLVATALAQGVGRLEVRSSAATLVVAAYNSSVKDQLNADYVCSSVDDHVQIQAAIDALPINGGTVLLLAGTYKANRIELSTGTTLAGVGWGTVLQQQPVANQRFIVQEGWATGDPDGRDTLYNITLRDMKIDGNNQAMNGIGPIDWRSNAGCVEFQKVNNLLVCNLLIEDPWATGIELTRCTGVKIVNNTVRRSADDGIAINEFCKHVLVSGNVIEDVAKIRRTGGPMGIEVQDGSSFVVVTGNSISYRGAYVPGAAHGDAAGDIGCLNINSHNGVAGVHHVTFSNNTIYSDVPRTSAFIIITGDSPGEPTEYVTVTGNSIQSDGTPSSSDHTKITWSNVNNVSISGNVFKGVAGGGVVGMRISGENTNAIISGNVFHGDRDSINFGAGTVMTNILINGNRFMGDANWFNLDSGTITFTDVSITNNMYFKEGIGDYDFRFRTAGDTNTYTNFEFSGNKSIGFPFRITPTNTDISSWIIRGNINYPSDNANYIANKVTLVEGNQTLLVVGEAMTITGHANDSAITAFSGGVDGQALRLLFTNDKVAIANDPGVIDLSVDFQSAEDTLLTFWYNGTSWYEVGRSDINHLVSLTVDGNVQLGDNAKTMWGTTNTDLQIYSDGDQGVFDLTGALYIRPSGDTDDYFSFTTAGGVPTIGTVGGCNLKITADSGTVDFDAALSMGNDKLIAVDTNAGITASTNRTQGQGALTAQVNEVATVANTDDTVTLPTAVAGIEIEIINNGAKTLQIFPASNDDLGLGVDVAAELEANERVKYVAYNITNWAKESTTEIIHAEIHDEDNTDPYVINDSSGDFHSYHTNGFAAGDLADWAFDAGGAGTSFPVASIADSPGSSGSQAEITTTGLHGLAAGDIVSLTNMSAGTNAGVHIVLAPIAATTFEITSSNSTTATGTMDQAATLEADAVAAGVYDFAYYISATSVGPNETFDFQLHKEATAIVGSKIRRKFGAGGDFGSMSGGGIVTVADGEKISFSLSNEDSAANLIIRNITIVLIRL